ncbi:hypothetical protein [Haloglomus salinum]|uniref:hypothetical protein n=1 Tax=Haloglomus salinum TaxID=2962673 RepID=UPI0020C9E55D|nr:hypothetical protein [Haloglomus salinum]
MTVTAPEFDPELNGYAAIERDGTVHAVSGEYDSEGEQNFEAHCGAFTIGSQEGGPRSEYLGEGYDWCGRCWPDWVIEE